MKKIMKNTPTHSLSPFPSDLPLEKQLYMVNGGSKGVIKWYLFGKSICNNVENYCSQWVKTGEEQGGEGGEGKNGLLIFFFRDKFFDLNIMLMFLN